MEIDFDAELARYHAEQSRRRSKGRHQSEIIKYIMTRLEPKRFAGSGEPDSKLWEIGFIWEEIAARVLTRKFGIIKHQVELERDGIFMTLDGWNSKLQRVREYKATKISSRHQITSNRYWHWHAQLKGYCLEMGTREAEIIPLYINGGYESAGGRFGAVACRPVVVEYSRGEIRENWDMMLRTRDRMDKEERAA